MVIPNFSDGKDFVKLFLHQQDKFGREGFYIGYFWKKGFLVGLKGYLRSK